MPHQGKKRAPILQSKNIDKQTKRMLFIKEVIRQQIKINSSWKSQEVLRENGH